MIGAPVSSERMTSRKGLRREVKFEIGDLKMTWRRDLSEWIRLLSGSESE